jgi:hypothetical protein
MALLATRRTCVCGDGGVWCVVRGEGLEVSVEHCLPPLPRSQSNACCFSSCE